MSTERAGARPLVVSSDAKTGLFSEKIRQHLLKAVLQPYLHLLPPTAARLRRAIDDASETTAVREGTEIE
jgi:hypothetical protein